MKKLLMMLLIAAATLGAQAQVLSPLDSAKLDIKNLKALAITAVKRGDTAALNIKNLLDVSAKKTDSIKFLYTSLKKSDSLIFVVRDSVQKVVDLLAVLRKDHNGLSDVINDWPAYKFSKDIKIDGDNNFIIDPAYFDKIKALLNSTKLVLSLQTPN